MKKQSLLPDELIINKIILLRDQKVLVDRDLADLYGVETRVLNQAVKRNIKRFPDDFMFQMTNEEMNIWKSQIVMSDSDRMGLRKPPFVFTEQGVAMLSSVLNSDTAILVNIQINGLNGLNEIHSNMNLHNGHNELDNHLFRAISSKRFYLNKCCHQ